MDRITRSYLATFRDEQDLHGLLDAYVFELFADYCVVADLYDEEFNVTDVHVGGPGDLGLDGVAIIVNGTIVSSPEEVEDLLRISGTLDVTFALVQAKSSGKFSSEEIGAFFEGVDDFFSEVSDLSANDAVKN